MGRNITAEFHSWVDLDTATNDVATATMAAVTGLSHYITGVSGSFSATADGALTLKDGATEIARWYVYDAFDVTFPSPVRLSPGTAANLTLAAGGATIDGAAVLRGYTQ